MLAFLFCLAVILIPFNGVEGITGLGEIQHEASVYVFLPALLLFICRYGLARHLPPAGLLGKVALCILGILAFSLVFNATTILDSHFRGRAGYAKALGAGLLVVYGFALAWMSYVVAARNTHALVVKPLLLGVCLCAGYAVLELLFWFGLDGGVYSQITHLVQPFGWSDVGLRLRSVAFEPPAFANYAGFAWPWSYAAFAASKGKQKLAYGLLLGLLSLMLVLTGSRIGLLLLATNGLGWLALRYVYLRADGGCSKHAGLVTGLVLCVLLGGGLYLFSHGEALIEYVVLGDSVSNLSRLASNVAAYNMFLDHPLFGVGYGQYGFHVSAVMPEWGYKSWEIRNWLTDENAAWPPVFSVYARFAAEMGLSGLLLWVGVWGMLIRKVWRAALDYQHHQHRLPVFAYPLLLSGLCVLVSGISYDSLRTPMLWITLGLACAFVEDARRQAGLVNAAMSEKPAAGKTSAAAP